MKKSTRNIIVSATLAAAGLGAAAAAGAHEYGYANGDRYVQHRVWQPAPRPWRNTCGAERWNPNVRYMPGDAVRRHGELFVARGISARVWNVNSPPEWTPNYWAAARCD